MSSQTIESLGNRLSVGNVNYSVFDNSNDNSFIRHPNTSSRTVTSPSWCVMFTMDTLSEYVVRRSKVYFTAFIDTSSLAIRNTSLVPDLPSSAYATRKLSLPSYHYAMSNARTLMSPSWSYIQSRLFGLLYGSSNLLSIRRDFEDKDLNPCLTSQLAGPSPRSAS
jgi:hypothetical protein